MNQFHEEPTPDANELILDSHEPALASTTNMTIKVYLYGEESPAETYRFED